MLEKKVRYTLNKNQRLKSRKTIEALFAGGKSFSLFPFKIIWNVSAGALPGQTGNLKAAFSVSKRYFKKATARNRIKRLMREAYRLQKNKLENSFEQGAQQGAIFILYVGNEIPEYKTVFDKIGSAIIKLQRVMHENTAADM